MNKLIKGDSSSLFNAPDLNKNRISLSSFKGEKVYLIFFRKAACPFCNMGLQELIKKHKEFEERGIKIIAFFASSREEIFKYAGKQNPPFPIIPDPNYLIYQRYGVEISLKGMLKTSFNPKKILKAMNGGFFSAKTTFQDPVMPADFLIDENQKIKKAHYGKTYDDHLLISKILKWNNDI